VDKVDEEVCLRLKALDRSWMSHQGDLSPNKQQALSGGLRL
jgi:hypothetical protein